MLSQWTINMYECMLWLVMVNMNKTSCCIRQGVHGLC